MKQSEFIREKFEEKFPVQFEGCRNNPFTYILKDGSCSAYNNHLEATCTFRYRNEHEYCLEISINRNKFRR